MLKPLSMVLLAAMVLGLSSCPSYVGAIFDEKVSEWKAGNPGSEPDKETLSRLYAEARGEAAEADQTLGRSAGQVATGVATGNWLGAILGLLGLVTTGAAVYKTSKKGQDK